MTGASATGDASDFSTNSQFASPAEVERAERAFYAEFLRGRMTVFDIGANVGELSVLFAKLVGEAGRVHAFEPGRENFERLTATIASSGLTNVIARQTAICDWAGQAELFIYDKDHATWNTMARRPLRDYGINLDPIGRESVIATTLDDYCEANGIERIDLLKIDVEGAELQVLRGARRMLEARRVRCCIFEFGGTTFDMGNKPDEIEAYLIECGYSARNLIAGQPNFPGRQTAATARYSMHLATPMD